MKNWCFLVAAIIGLVLLWSCKNKIAVENGLPRLQVSENQKFLQTEEGDPFFWLGDTGWLLFTKLTREQVETYFDDRTNKGYNVIQAMVLHTLEPCNVYGDSAISGKDVSKPITTEGDSFEVASQYDYWDHVDYVVDLAAQKGLYMALVPVWGSNVKSGKVSQKQAESYGHWLAERYSNRAHIIWLNGGDIPGSDSIAVWNALGKALNEGAPDHLITFHPRGRTTSSTWFHNEPWLDFNMFQSGHRRYDQDDTEWCFGEDNWRYVEHDLAMEPIKPTIDGEPSYEGIPHGLHDPLQPLWTDSDLRRYAYWSVFAGGFGFTYGHSAIMQFYTDTTIIGAYFNRKLWDVALNDPGAGQMQHLKNLILSLPFFERIPDQTLIASNQGEKYDRIIATRGETYALLYTYNGREFTVNMGKIAGETVQATWFDPRTGQEQTIGDFPNIGVQSFDPPGEITNGNDWVLILDTL